MSSSNFFILLPCYFLCLQVDKYQNTTANNVYALGDVCGNVELTPMAIAAARRLADRFVDCLLLLWYISIFEIEHLFGLILLVNCVSVYAYSNCLLFLSYYFCVLTT